VFRGAESLSGRIAIGPNHYRAESLPDALNLAVFELDTVTDSQVIDAFEVKLARCAIVESNLHAIELILTFATAFDRIASNRATKDANARGQRLAAASAEPVADNAADHGTQNRTRASRMLSHLYVADILDTSVLRRWDWRDGDGLGRVHDSLWWRRDDASSQ
jgi:hypothetical protein